MEGSLYNIFTQIGFTASLLYVHNGALDQLRKLVIRQLYVLRVIGIGCEERLCLIFPG